MELVEEYQKPPLLFEFIFTVGIIVTSLIFTHFTADTRAQANEFYWLTDRAAGVIAYELLSLSAILGVSMTSAMWDRKGLRKWARQLHQYLTLLVCMACAPFHFVPTIRGGDDSRYFHWN